MSEKFKFEKGKYYLVVSLDENEMDICTIGPWDKWNKQYDLTFLRPEMGLVSEDAMSINYRVIGEVPSPDIVERLNAQIMELEKRLEEAEGEDAMKFEFGEKDTGPGDIVTFSFEGKEHKIDARGKTMEQLADEMNGIAGYQIFFIGEPEKRPLHARYAYYPRTNPEDGIVKIIKPIEDEMDFARLDRAAPGTETQDPDSEPRARPS